MSSHPWIPSTRRFWTSFRSCSPSIPCNELPCEKHWTTRTFQCQSQIMRFETSNHAFSLLHIVILRQSFVGCLIILRGQHLLQFNCTKSYPTSYMPSEDQERLWKYMYLAITLSSRQSSRWQHRWWWLPGWPCLIFGFPGAFLPHLYFFPSVSLCYLCSNLTHFAYSDPLSNVSVKPTHVPCSFTISSLRCGSPFLSSLCFSFICITTFHLRRNSSNVLNIDLE
jgi:hypothetical protein